MGLVNFKNLFVNEKQYLVYLTVDRSTSEEIRECEMKGRPFRCCCPGNGFELIEAIDGSLARIKTAGGLYQGEAHIDQRGGELAIEISRLKKASGREYVFEKLELEFNAHMANGEVNIFVISDRWYDRKTGEEAFFKD